MSISLSQRQLLYLIKLFRVCQELFLFIFWSSFSVLRVVFATDDILSCIFLFVNNFFHFILLPLCRHFVVRSATFDILSCCVLFVNIFFILLLSCRLNFARCNNICYINTLFSLMQAFFKFFILYKKHIEF